MERLSSKSGWPNEANGCAAILSTHAVGFGDPLKLPDQQSRIEFSKAMTVLKRIANEDQGVIIQQGHSGITIAFETASRAVLVAARFQRLVPAIGPLRHRIGIHYGDAAFTGQAVVGDAYRVANELILHSAPGGFCISQAVYRLAGPFSNYKVFGPTNVKLESIAEQLLVYRVLTDQVTPSKRAETADAASSDTQPPLIRSSIVSGLVAFLIVVFGVSILGSSMFNGSSISGNPPEPSNPSTEQVVDDSLKVGPLRPEEQGTYDSSVAIRPSTDPVQEPGEAANSFKAEPTGEPLIDGAKAALNPPSVPEDSSANASVPLAHEEQSTDFAEVRPMYLARYDFLGLARWIKKQTWGNSPTGKDMARHYIELEAFIAAIDRDLRIANASHPLLFSTGVKENVMNAKAWMENDHVVIMVAHQVRYAKLRDLSPRFVADIAEELIEFSPRTRHDAAEYKLWLQYFIDEYGLKSRRDSRMSDSRF